MLFAAAFIAAPAPATTTTQTKPYNIATGNTADCGGFDDVCFTIPTSTTHVTITVNDSVSLTGVGGRYFFYKGRDCYPDGYGGHICYRGDVIAASTGSFCTTVPSVVIPTDAYELEVWVSALILDPPCGGIPRPGISGSVKAEFSGP